MSSDCRTLGRWLLKVTEDDGKCVGVGVDGVSAVLVNVAFGDPSDGQEEDPEVGYDAVTGCCVIINGAGAGVTGAERRADNFSEWC